MLESDFSLRISIILNDNIQDLAHVSVGDQERATKAFNNLQEYERHNTTSKANVELINSHGDVIDDFPTSQFHAGQIASHFKLRAKYLNSKENISGKNQ